MRAESLSGGDEGIRTLGPHVANVMLSQLSYIPTRHGAQRRAGKDYSAFPASGKGYAPALCDNDPHANEQ